MSHLGNPSVPTRSTNTSIAVPSDTPIDDEDGQTPFEDHTFQSNASFDPDTQTNDMFTGPDANGASSSAAYDPSTEVNTTVEDADEYDIQFDYPPSPEEDPEEDETDHDTVDLSEPATKQVSTTNASEFSPFIYEPCNAGLFRKRRVRAIRLRRKGTKGVNKKLMTIPLEPWCPATRKTRPIARTCMTSDASINFNANENTSDCDQTAPSSRALGRKRPLPSERKGWRLLQAWVNYRDPHGHVKTGRVQLDSQSNVNYSLPDVSLGHMWNPDEKTTVVGITKEVVDLGRPLASLVHLSARRDPYRH